MLKKTVTVLLTLVVVWGMTTQAQSRPKKPVDGPTVFEETCFKCHTISGVPPFDGADATKKDLRQALSDQALIEDRITNGIKKGTAEMPAFKYKTKFMKEEFPVLLEWLTSLK
ncbi:MAG: hypothetical protein COX57_08075 [Alphaproteobacteria bacterium CG_4_10_14_0_2_um_filter_63_37]|nr:MAG: hypothetical protein AUJ55_02550 [Proteobacteria bacterium CG1_02_64_396]PJA24576.1 MAG: hypothetical protein COX57_08075 [Alphaproteobacteria bacterium CG_4_10_14_0_2_um_filter_63_37]